MFRTRAAISLLLLAAVCLAGCAPTDDPAWAAPAPTATPSPTATIVPQAAFAMVTATSLPVSPTATPLPTATPSPTVGPPPRVLASYPVSGDRAIVPERPLVLVFDRAMDRDSVAASLGIAPESEITVTWASDTQVAIVPAQPWQPETAYELTLGAQATAADGAALASPFTLSFKAGGNGAPVPVLMYHHFADLGADATQGQRDWTVSPEALKEQLDYLASHGWHTVSPTQLADYLAEGAPLPLRPIVISIDDGYREVLDVGLPLFAATDLRPVLFIVTDYVDYSAYLNWDELAQLVAAGFMVGSHSVDHSDLKQVDAAELERQIAGSKALLAEHLGVTVDAFCYPFGSLNKTVKTAVGEAGYRTAYSLNPTIYQAPDEPLFMGRMRVDYGTTLEQFAEMLPD